jgi:Spy/CpxP family protein refolding chaperone
MKRIASLALLAWMVASPAWAQPPRHRPLGPGPIERGLERDADRLGLEANTRAEIRKIAREARTRAEDRRGELEKLHQELRALLDAPEPDEAAVLAEADRIGALETEMHKDRLRTLLRIRALLTPEQRAELVKIQAEREQERGGTWRKRRWSSGPEDAPEPPPNP